MRVSLLFFYVLFCAISWILHYSQHLLPEYGNNFFSQRPYVNILCYIQFTNCFYRFTAMSTWLQLASKTSRVVSAIKVAEYLRVMDVNNHFVENIQMNIDKSYQYKWIILIKNMIFFNEM
jgi:hypothetical protein